MTKKERFYRVLVLGLLSAVGPFSIDMYLPAFPDIASHLHASIGYIGLSLSSFFIGISVGQLLYGPVLDRFGRKPPLYVGLVLYLLTSLGCVFAASAEALIILRFLQALGACGGMVAARAMVRDLFPVNEIAKIFGTLMLVIGVSPIIAPTVGGYITSAFGWHYVFVVLAGLDMVILASVYMLLPESKHGDPTLSLKVRPILKNFRIVFRQPQFYTYAFAGAIASSGLYAYIAGSPSVFMEMHKVNEKEYGWIFAFNAFGLILSSQVNGIFLRKWRSEQIIRVALLLQTIAGTLLFALAILQLDSLFTTIFLIFVFLCCQGFIFPNSSALSLAPFSSNAGSASALLGAIQMSIGTLSSGLVSVLTNGTARPMSGVMAACAFSSFLILNIGRKIIYNRERIEDVKEETAEMVSTL